MRRYSSNGPWFGAGPDLRVNSNMTTGYTYFGHSYVCPVGSNGSTACRNWLAGSPTGWKIVELEVFVKQ